MTLAGLVARLWLAVHSTPEQVEGLQSFAPQDLTSETARQHMTAAWTASLIAGPLEAYPEAVVDPYLLLYIAWHESRFRPGTVTREPRGKVSCGVMTPVPSRRCHRASLVEQYVAGAAHLRGWYDACLAKSVSAHMDSGLHDRCALLGYAGGFALIRACAHRGHMWRRRGARRVDLCATADLYRSGADDLRDAVGKDVR